MLTLIAISIQILLTSMYFLWNNPQLLFLCEVLLSNNFFFVIAFRQKKRFDYLYAVFSTQKALFVLWTWRFCAWYAFNRIYIKFWFKDVGRQLLLLIINLWSFGHYCFWIFVKSRETLLYLIVLMGYAIMFFGFMLIESFVVVVNYLIAAVLCSILSRSPGLNLRVCETQFVKLCYSFIFFFHQFLPQVNKYLKPKVIKLENSIVTLWKILFTLYYFLIPHILVVQRMVNALGQKVSQWSVLVTKIRLIKTFILSASSIRLHNTDIPTLVELGYPTSWQKISVLCDAIYANDNFYLWTSSKFFHSDLVKHLMEYTEKNMPLYLRTNKIYYQGDFSYSDKTVFEVLKTVKTEHYNDFIFNEFINYLEIQITKDPLLPIRFWFDEEFRYHVWYDFMWQHLHFILFKSPNNTLLSGIISNQQNAESVWFSYPNLSEISYTFERWGYTITKLNFDFWTYCYELLGERFFSHLLYDSYMGKTVSSQAFLPNFTLWDSTFFTLHQMGWFPFVCFVAACFACFFYYKPYQYELLDRIAYGIDEVYSSSEEGNEEDFHQEDIDLGLGSEESMDESPDIPKKSIMRIKFWLYEKTGIDLFINREDSDEENEPLFLFFTILFLSFPIYMIQSFYPTRQVGYQADDFVLTYYDYNCFLYRERDTVVGGSKDVFYRQIQQEMAPILVTADRWHNYNLDTLPEHLIGPLIYNYEFYYGFLYSFFDYDVVEVWYADAYTDELLAMSMIDDADQVEDELQSTDPDDDMEAISDEISAALDMRMRSVRLAWIESTRKNPREGFLTALEILRDLRVEQIERGRKTFTQIYYTNPLAKKDPTVLNTCYELWLSEVENVLFQAVAVDEEKQSFLPPTPKDYAAIVDKYAPVAKMPQVPVVEEDEEDISLYSLVVSWFSGDDNKINEIKESDVPVTADQKKTTKGGEEVKEVNNEFKKNPNVDYKCVSENPMYVESWKVAWLRDFLEWPIISYYEDDFKWILEDYLEAEKAEFMERKNPLTLDDMITETTVELQMELETKSLFDSEYDQNFIIKVPIGTAKPELEFVKVRAYDEFFQPMESYFKEIPEPSYVRLTVGVERILWHQILSEYVAWEQSRIPDLFQEDEDEFEEYIADFENTFDFLDVFSVEEYVDAEVLDELEYLVNEDLEEECFSEFFDGLNFSAWFHNDDADDEEDDALTDMFDESFAGNQFSVFYTGVKDEVNDFVYQEYTAEDLCIPIFEDAEFSIYEDEDDDDELLSWNDEIFREAAPQETSDPEPEFFPEMEPVFPDETINAGENDVIEQAREYLSDKSHDAFFDQIWSWMQSEWYYEFVDVEEMEAEGFGLIPDDYSLEEEDVEILPIEVSVGESPLWVREVLIKPDYAIDVVEPISLKGVKGKTSSFFLLDYDDPVIHEDLDEALALSIMWHDWQEEVNERLNEPGVGGIPPVLIDPLMVAKYLEYADKKESTYAPRDIYDLFFVSVPEYTLQQLVNVDKGTLAESSDLFVFEEEKEDDDLNEGKQEIIDEPKTEPKPVEVTMVNTRAPDATEINLYNYYYSDFCIAEDAQLAGDFYKSFFWEDWQTWKRMNRPQNEQDFLSLLDVDMVLFSRPLSVEDNVRLRDMDLQLTTIGKLAYPFQYPRSGYVGMNLDSWLDVLPSDDLLNVYTGISPISAKDDDLDAMQIGHALLSPEVSYMNTLKKITARQKSDFNNGEIPDLELVLEPLVTEHPDDDYRNLAAPELYKDRDNFPMMELWEFYNPHLALMPEEEQLKENDYTANVLDHIYLETVMTDAVSNLPSDIMHTETFDELLEREAMVEDYNEDQLEYLSDGQLRNEGEMYFEEDALIDTVEFDLDIEDDDEEDEDEDYEIAQINDHSRELMGNDPWQLPKESLSDLRQEKLLVGLYGFSQPQLNTNIPSGKVPPLLINGTELFTLQEVFGLWEEMSMGSQPVDWFDVITHDGRIEESPMALGVTEGLYLRRFDGFIGRSTDEKTRKLMLEDFNLVDYLESLISGYTELNSHLSREYALYDFFFNNFGVLPGNVMDSLMYATYWTHNWCDFIYNSCFINNHLEMVQKDETDGLFEHHSTLPTELYSIINEQVHNKIHDNIPIDDQEMSEEEFELYYDANLEFNFDATEINAYTYMSFLFEERLLNFGMTRSLKPQMHNPEITNWNLYLNELRNKAFKELLRISHEKHSIKSLHFYENLCDFIDDDEDEDLDFGEFLTETLEYLQSQHHDLCEFQRHLKTDLSTNKNPFIQRINQELGILQKELAYVSEIDFTLNQDQLPIIEREQKIRELRNLLNDNFQRLTSDPVALALFDYMKQPTENRHEMVAEDDELSYIMNRHYFLSNEGLERAEALNFPEDEFFTLKRLTHNIFNDELIQQLGIHELIHREIYEQVNAPYFDSNVRLLNIKTLSPYLYVLPLNLKSPFVTDVLSQKFAKEKNLLNILPRIPQGPKFMYESVPNIPESHLKGNDSRKVITDVPRPVSESLDLDLDLDLESNVPVIPDGDYPMDPNFNAFDPAYDHIFNAPLPEVEDESKNDPTLRLIGELINAQRESREVANDDQAMELLVQLSQLHQDMLSERFGQPRQRLGASPVETAALESLKKKSNYAEMFPEEDHQQVETEIQKEIDDMRQNLNEVEKEAEAGISDADFERYARQVPNNQNQSYEWMEVYLEQARQELLDEDDQLVAPKKKKTVKSSPKPESTSTPNPSKQKVMKFKKRYQ